MSEKTLRIVQVGVAPTGIGSAWLSFLQKAPDWQLVGVVDVVPEHRAAAVERAQLATERGFSSIEDAARSVEFDAVAIVAPSPLHTDLCLQALRAGKHVVVEKPFAIDFEQARAVVALAEQRNLRVVIDQNYRFLPDVEALRSAVQGQLAGVPAFVTVSFNYDWPARTYQTGMDNPMLLEMAIHHFDSIRFVLGTDPLSVSGDSWRPPWSLYKGDTWVTGMFQFPETIRVQYDGSLEAPGARDNWQGVWRVECEHGALHLGEHGQGYGLYRSRSPEFFELVEPFSTVPDPGSAIPRMLQAFATNLREASRPQSDGRDNLKTLAMAFGLKRSSDERRIVDLSREFDSGLGQ